MLQVLGLQLLGGIEGLLLLLVGRASAERATASLPPIVGSDRGGQQGEPAHLEGGGAPPCTAYRSISATTAPTPSVVVGAKKLQCGGRAVTWMRQLKESDRKPCTQHHQQIW